MVKTAFSLLIFANICQKSGRNTPKRVAKVPHFRKKPLQSKLFMLK